MTRALRTLLVTAVAALALTGQAQAAGGNYVFDGGTPKQRTQVRSALNASSFNWSLVPAQITIHITRGGDSEATRGEIWVSGRLLDSGRFAWGVVQHEYAHQVDFFLFDDATRAQLLRLLNGREWFPGTTRLDHSQYGAERFASTLAWTYWQSPANSMRPTSAKHEAASLAPSRFRALMTQLVGRPDSLAAKGK